MAQDVLDQLMECLLQEAAEIVSHAETCMLKLETHPNNPEMVQEIFRAMHTLKGSCASVGLAELSTFAHEIESTLTQVKMGRKVTPPLVSALLLCIDGLRRWFDGVRRGQNAGIDVSEARAALKNLDCAESVKPPDLSVPQDDIVFLQDPATGKNLDQPMPFAYVAQKPSAVENDDAQEDLNELVTLPIKKIETLLDSFGEQVILQSMLENIKDDLVNNQELAKKTIEQLSKITYSLQNAAMSLRMVSLKSFFIKMQRACRDTCITLSKKVNLDVSGEETELDKHMVDKLSGFVTHIVRNSLDHGIETPAERLEANKDEQGTLRLKAQLQGGFFYLEIEDDGRGINRQRVLEKAKKQGIIGQDAVLSDQEIVMLIFHPGFSTKEAATELSGRGFGMDIVQHEVTRMHGSISIESEEGKYTKTTIRLPLTLAIFNGIVVNASGEVFIIPSSEVHDITRIPNSCCVALDSQRTVATIGKNVMPVVRVSDAMCVARNKKRAEAAIPCDEHVLLLVQNNNRPYALCVDELLGIQRVVLKNLGRELKGCPGVSGGAILSDGSVALILETAKVVDLYESRYGAQRSH